MTGSAEQHTVSHYTTAPTNRVTLQEKLDQNNTVLTKNGKLSRHESQQSQLRHMDGKPSRYESQQTQLGDNKTVRTMHGKVRLDTSDHKLAVRKHIPDVIIGGAKKCGTGALTAFLSYHPSVAMTRGEVHYFDNNYSKGIHWYLQKMPVSTPDQLVIEGTPKYLIKPGIPQKVYKDISPKTKIVFIFCDPVYRAVSDYVHERKMNTDGYTIKKTFEASVLDTKGTLVRDNKLISTGVYIQYLQNWLQVFPSTQIHIVDGEVLKTDPSGELQSLETFLNITQFFTRDNFYFNKEKGFYCLRKPKEKCLNKHKGRHHPKVRQEILEKLTDYYLPFNNQLEEISKLQNLTDHTLNFI
ncbi:heparan sulfate glucosamine 3-O-sulfotransferase 1-like [Glandiceps talaboti]